MTIDILSVDRSSTFCTQ